MPTTDYNVSRNTTVMISRFHVKNFRSIVDLDLSFRYGEGKAPGGYKDMQTMPFLEDKTGRYVPCMAIYGANASGKTNLVKAMITYSRLLLDRAKVSYASLNNNKLHPELKVTTLEMEWSDGDNLFYFSITLDDAGVVGEKFYHNSVLLYDIENTNPDFRAIARPDYPPEKLNTIFDVECVASEPRRQVSCFLPKLVRNLPGLQSVFRRAYVSFIKNINIDPAIAPAWLAFNRLENASYDANRDTLRDRVFDLVKRFDLGIKDIKYQRELVDRTEKDAALGYPWSSVRNGDKIQKDSITTCHTDINGNTVQFDIQEESLGTRQLISLFCLIVAALETGRTLVIDEIDRSLHPLILREIVRLFKSREHNPKQAQLIFTTHTTDLLEGNLLRVSEVAIIEKTLAKGTTVERLSDHKDLRNVADFRKRYLEGEFRGIPFPYI